MPATETPSAAETPVPARRLPEIFLTFLRLGFTGFGGPLAHIALMDDLLVERRRWLSKERFLEGLAVCQMLPGPASTQLGIYIGYVRGGVAGAFAAGAGFILPAFGIILALSWIYFALGALPDVSAVFHGISPLVIALIGVATWRMGRSAVTDRFLAALFAAAVLVTFLGRVNEVITFGAAGVAATARYLLDRYRPRRPVPEAVTEGASTSRDTGRGGSPEEGPAGGTGTPSGAALVPLALGAGAAAPILWQLTLFFLKVGALIFGGGLVIIPFIQREVVQLLGWLSEREFIDGIALGQITPGPVVITAAFIGYKVAGVVGAAVATGAIFAPSFAFILLAAPHLARLRRSAAARAFLAGVNAAVVGAIAATTLILARAAVTDPWALAILGTSLVAILRYRVDTLWLVAGAGVAGWAVRMLLP